MALNERRSETIPNNRMKRMKWFEQIVTIVGCLPCTTVLHIDIIMQWKVDLIRLHDLRQSLWVRFHCTDAYVAKYFLWCVSAGSKWWNVCIFLRIQFQKSVQNASIRRFWNPRYFFSFTSTATSCWCTDCQFFHGTLYNMDTSPLKNGLPFHEWSFSLSFL